MIKFCDKCGTWHDGPCPFDEAGPGEHLMLIIAGVVVGAGIWLLIWVLS